MPSTDDSRDPRVYLAVERTFLAWIRTGLALMGFGFVVARFGLFLRELAAMRAASAELSGLSVPVGTGLIVIGVAVNILASINHVRFIKRLNQWNARSRTSIRVGTGGGPAAGSGRPCDGDIFGKP